MLQEWASINRPLWKKARAFSFIVTVIDSEYCSSCIEIIREQVLNSTSGNTCKLPSSSAAFYLLSLDALLGRLSSSRVKISDVLVTLASVLDFELASKLHLSHLKASFDEIVATQKIDYRIMQCSYFASDSAFTSSFLTSFSKSLSELKGLPDQFVAISKFLKTFYMACHAEKTFIEVIDRLSKRNSTLSSFIFSDLVSFVSFTAETVTLYDSVVETLCQVDNEAVISSMLKIAIKLPVSKVLLSKVQISFKGYGPRTKEIVAEFISTLVNGKHALELPDFGEFLQKEMNADSTLASLIQYCACASSAHLNSFLASNLKSSQRLSTRSAIMLGLLKANFNNWNDGLMQELFSASFVKDAGQNSTAGSLVVYVGAFVALIQNPQFHCDSKVLNDSLIALSKPGGVALGCEKGWTQMDDALIAIWIEKVIAPVVFGGARSELMGLCTSSLAWLVIFGKEKAFKLIVKNLTALCLETTDSLSIVLKKLVSSSELVEASIHRIWKFVKAIACESNLNSAALATLCHHEKLLGNGDASWPELVRKHVSVLDDFCNEFSTVNDVSLFVNSPFLLISIISLSPQVINKNFNLPSRVFNDIDALKNVSKADWNAYFAEPESNKSSLVPKSAPSRPCKPQTAQAVDNSALKEAINELVSNLKVSVSFACSAARALPFHSSFTAIRPEIICSLLDLLFSVPRLAEVPSLGHSLYVISAESFDGQGSLLVSLFLNYSGLTSVVDPSWSISDVSSLFSSCVEIAKKMTGDEFFFACEAFFGALPRMSREIDCLKTLISILSCGIKNISLAKTSCAKMTASLIEIAVLSPELCPLITVSHAQVSLFYYSFFRIV